MKTNVAIIGAGPAGLTAAYLLSKNEVSVTVLEADPVYVGGISRTATYKGFHFDIGGHRFFSKSKEVNDLWTRFCRTTCSIGRALAHFLRRQIFCLPPPPVRSAC
jgi:protoporphyrinogen oxidase